MIINLLFSKVDETLIYAAEELKSYLSLLDIDLNFTENVTPINYTIALEANPQLTECGLPAVTNSYLDDQYFIKITSKEGRIIGSNSRSVLLGVYNYLYQLGFRFLYPNKKYDYIPQIQSIQELYVTNRQTASNRHRGVCIEGANSIENILDFIEWMPKLGYNSFFVQFQIPYTFMARWYEHEKNPHLPQEEFNENIATAYSKLIDKEMEKRSLLHHRVGHGWTCETIGYPSLGWMKTDWNIQDNIQPYLAQIDGKRAFYKNIPINTNLCYSNLDVIEAFTNNVVNYAKEHLEVDYLHIWIADEFNNICECDECNKTTPSDQYVHLLNVIDEKMTTLGLSTHLVFLLYQELLWAPKKEQLKNPSRFTLMFAPISRTFENSYSIEEEYQKPPEYIRNKIQLPVNLQENISFLKEWQQIFSGDSFVYDYPLGRAHYGDLGYTSIAKVISSDIKELCNLQMNGYISCQELRVGLPNALPNYVMGYTLFDNNISFNELELDYFKHAYGEDYSLALNYLEKLSLLSSPDYFNGKGARENIVLHNNFEKSLSVINNFNHTIKKNIEKYANNNNSTVLKKNIHEDFWKLLDYHAEYSLRLTKALSSISASEATKTNELWKEFHEYVCSKEESYQTSLDVYRVIEVATKYTGFILNEMNE